MNDSSKCDRMCGKSLNSKIAHKTSGIFRKIAKNLGWNGKCEVFAIIDNVSFFVAKDEREGETRGRREWKSVKSRCKETEEEDGKGGKGHQNGNPMEMDTLQNSIR